MSNFRDYEDNIDTVANVYDPVDLVAVTGITAEELVEVLGISSETIVQSFKERIREEVNQDNLKTEVI